LSFKPNVTFKIAKREDFKCSYHKEVINICDGRYANFPGLIIPLCIYVAKCHIVLYKCIQLKSVNEK
jgi:hypothetical protein